MLTLLVAIVLLAASIGAIYFILKSMGEAGVEAAAPGSCRSGRCGVRKEQSTEANCQTRENQGAEIEEVDGVERVERLDAIQPVDGVKSSERA